MPQDCCIYWVFSLIICVLLFSIVIGLTVTLLDVSVALGRIKM